MALGQLAYQWGWILDQVRVVRQAGTERRGELPVPAGLRRRVRTTGEHVVALTFDDGPSDQTRSILETLRRLNVPATFFVTGAQALERPELVREIVAGGHAIGTSGWQGRSFTEIDSAELEHELMESLTVIKEITGTPALHVRPPRGVYDQRVVTVLQRLGLHIWLWTSHPGDVAPGSSAPDIVSVTADGLMPGSVILLHDSAHSSTLEALPEIVRMARERKFRFVPLEEHPPLAEPRRASVTAQHDGAYAGCEPSRAER
jgi:peptidoglycan/xylan/chitin deacetylase (PgdA/CDA1 family)